MRINTCGSKEKPCILLLHTMFTTGRLFEALIPALAQDYFLVIPTLDGYDPDEKTEYPGTGEELERVEACLKEKQVRELATAAGSSLGAMLAWGLWQRRRLPIRRLVLDSPPFGWSAVQAAENTKSFWQLVQAVQAAPEPPMCLMRTTGNSVQKCGIPAEASPAVRSAAPVKHALALSCRGIFRAAAQRLFWFTAGRTPITSTGKRIWRIGRIFPWW